MAKPDARRTWTVGGVVARLGILAGAVAIVALAARADTGGRAAHILLSHPAGVALAAVAGAYGTFALAMNLLRLALALVYRPIPAPNDDQLPSVTVVVPAYNEGRLVRETLLSLLASDYPAGRMQIIAVDDGSTDDTWKHIKRTARESAGRVAAIRCPVNRGKRWALHEGFVRATGDVIVTVDSDSVVSPATLRRLVAPLAADATVGAVAGNVRVLNRDEGLIPRLLSVAFVFAFDFSRAAESVLGSVL
ncbi:MAG: glycosyltransferase family 2 protein [Phycisphaerae bacterium]|nr:glycosyltransferase family 2 protein [Phycisphaerae bacterium]